MFSVFSNNKLNPNGPFKSRRSKGNCSPLKFDIPRFPASLFPFMLWIYFRCILCVASLSFFSSKFFFVSDDFLLLRFCNFNCSFRVINLSFWFIKKEKNPLILVVFCSVSKGGKKKEERGEEEEEEEEEEERVRYFNISLNFCCSFVLSSSQISLTFFNYPLPPKKF